MNLPRYVSPREALNSHLWAWKDDSKANPETLLEEHFLHVKLTEDNRNIMFHRGWSSGTSVVRGDQPFTIGNNYYWEMKIGTAPYGTDVMVGVGTADVKLYSMGLFVSILGLNEDSWGLSYTGKFQHGGSILEDKGMAFGCGDFVGVHLDMWKGSLTFFVNGVAVCEVNDVSLKKQTLYPMVCSTSASTSLHLIYSYSTTSDCVLQNMCLKTLDRVTHGISEVSKLPGLSKECVKKFFEVKYVPKMSKEYCSKLEGNLDYLTEKEEESSEEDKKMSIVEKRQSRRLKYGGRKKTLKSVDSVRLIASQPSEARFLKIHHNDYDEI